MAGRASIVGAAATHVGKVRDHNEDAHFIDPELGVFLVCDGMGGHAAGEVASALAIRAIRSEWSSDRLRAVAEQWLERGTPDLRKQLIDVVRAGVIAAHHAILAEADRDDSKSGMGTTLVGAMIVGGELVFAHAGDSRAYLVRDGIAMQLTEDHTLLARLLAAGIDVDVSGEGARFRSMLTNALGIGEECKVSTFAVPLADGDRFLLCSDGISEYVPEAEVGDVLVKQPSPARAAQKLIDLALERGGGDNATAVVVRVLEAGETPLPAEQRKRDDAAIAACALWGRRVTPQQRLRALRIAIARDLAAGDKLPPYTLGDRVAWIVVDGELVQDGLVLGPGALIYPESLMAEPQPLPDRDALAAARGEIRVLAIRADDFRELCDDDGELGEALVEALNQVIAKRRARPAPTVPVDPGGETDPQLRSPGLRDPAAAAAPTDPGMPVLPDPRHRDRAATVPDGGKQGKPWVVESAKIGPAAPRAASPQLVVHPPTRPSPPMPVRPGGTGSPVPAAAPRLTPPGGTRLESMAKPSSPRLTPPGGTRLDAGSPTGPGEPVRTIASRERIPTPTGAPPVRSELPRATAKPATESPAPSASSPSLPRAETPAPSASSPSLPRAEVPAPSSSAHADSPSPPVVPASAYQRPPLPLRPPGPTPPPPVHPPPAMPANDRSWKRAPSEPEIETFFEIEADLPPEPGSIPDGQQELSVDLGLDLDDHDDHEISIIYGDDLTVQVQVAPPPTRRRPITAQDAAAVSGTISIPEELTVKSSPPPAPPGTPARRAKRHDGLDD